MSFRTPRNLVAVTSKEIVQALNIEPEQVTQIKAVLRLVDFEEVKEYADTLGHDIFGQFYHNPKLEHAQLLLLDAIIGTCGIEVLNSPENDCQDSWNWTPDFEYLNTGDTYALTIMYSHSEDKYFLASWGDVAEAIGH